jgi:hypothetical protein
LFDGPLARDRFSDGDVFDGGKAVMVTQCHAATDKFSQDAHLAPALSETSKVDEPGRDDLATTHAGHSANREEDAAASGHFHDEADHAGWVSAAVDHQHVANAAHAVTGGVKDGAA